MRTRFFFRRQQGQQAREFSSSSSDLSSSDDDDDVGSTGERTATTRSSTGCGGLESENVSISENGDNGSRTGGGGGEYQFLIPPPPVTATRIGRGTSAPGSSRVFHGSKLFDDADDHDANDSRHPLLAASSFPPLDGRGVELGRHRRRGGEQREGELQRGAQVPSTIDTAKRGMTAATTSPSKSPRTLARRRSMREEIRESLHAGPLNDDEEYEGDDPLLNAMDRLEDEIDEHTTDLLPLQVRLVLEQNVFGWSHLLSDILGHVVFTGGAALVAYYAISWLLLSDAHHPIIQWFRQWHQYEHGGKPPIPGRDDGLPGPVRPILGITLEVFVTVRTIVTVLAAVAAFRTVRRRRRVWLHSAYGTRAYERDQARRQMSLREVDRTTTLGRLRNKVVERNARRRARKVQKKLRRAHSRFERMHARQRNRHRHAVPATRRKGSTQGLAAVPAVPTVHHVDSPPTPPAMTPTKRFSSCPPILPPAMTPTRGFSSSCPPIRPHGAPEQLLVSPGANSGVDSWMGLHHGGGGGGARTACITKSICRDHVAISEIELLPYAHGGFFGAAPFMLADPVWVNILRELMPDVYVEVARRIFAPTPKLIHWAENNPVVAAYGTVHENEAHGRITTLEWDVFLDPSLVQRLLQAIHDLETYDLERGDERKKKKWRGDERDQRRTLLKKEVQRRTLVLLEQMLIAHGSLYQLVLEQTGRWKQYNFSRVKRQRRTLGGGIFAQQWLAVYAWALQMATNPHSIVEEDEETEIEEEDEEGTGSSSSSTDDGGNAAAEASTSSTGSPSKAATSATQIIKVTPLRRKRMERVTSLRSAGLCPETDMVESIEMVQQIMGAPLGLVLDIKSRHVPKKVWALLVDVLRDCGARVEGVASFTSGDIRGISGLCTTRVKEVYFFHSAGDIQHACHSGQVKRGDTVFFNAGSLLWDGAQTLSAYDLARLCIFTFDPDETKTKYAFQPYAFIDMGNDGIDGSGEHFPFAGNFTLSTGGKSLSGSSNCCRSTVADYKRHFGLSIGLYCQEFAIDDAAIDLLVRFVNAHPEIYNLGLSWGGVNGYTVKGIQPGRFTSTDGFWNQRYGGIAWDPEKVPAEDGVQRQMTIDDIAQATETEGVETVPLAGCNVAM